MPDTCGAANRSLTALRRVYVPRGGGEDAVVKKECKNGVFLQENGKNGGFWGKERWFFGVCVY
jgi:hypothetical protein